MILFLDTAIMTRIVTVGGPPVPCGLSCENTRARASLTTVNVAMQEMLACIDADSLARYTHEYEFYFIFWYINVTVKTVI